MSPYLESIAPLRPYHPDVQVMEITDLKQVLPHSPA